MGRERDRGNLKTIPESLLKEKIGRQAFACLLKTWLKRSGWSYAVFADLAEVATIMLEASGIPRFQEGKSILKGELFIDNGHVWRAATDNVKAKPPRAREAATNKDWEHICSVRKVVASQVHNAAREELTQATLNIFIACGLLNQYIEGFQAGRYKGPADTRLRQRASEGIVIRDEQGTFGFTEFCSVFTGNLKIPEMCQAITDQDAINLSAQVAREIRQAIVECGLDLIEDWPQFISAYPTSDPVRHARIRDVALGLERWSAEQVRDEQAAVAIAISRLRTRHGLHKSSSSPPSGVDRSQIN